MIEPQNLALDSLLRCVREMWVVHRRPIALNVLSRKYSKRLKSLGLDMERGVDVLLARGLVARWMQSNGKVWVMLAEPWNEMNETQRFELKCEAADNWDPKKMFSEAKKVEGGKAWVNPMSWTGDAREKLLKQAGVEIKGEE